jgi:hypothetical protein
MHIGTSGDNPPRNVLGAGVTDAAVFDAVSRSGYPLQTVVAEKLSQAFHVREEWSYLDRDTKNLRTIDVVASCPLYELADEQPRVRPQLDVLIECKKSDLPFVFFSTRHKPWLRSFPLVAGLKSREITLVTDDNLSTWTTSILNVLGLLAHPFHKLVPVSNTFSKCVRRGGGELELSGEDSYNGVVLPLIKAAAHFEATEAPRDTHVYFDSHLTVPVAVVDAPMVLFETTNGASTAILKPWIRVARHEYDRDSHEWQKDRLWAIDVVHVDFLDEYVEKHLMPFAKEFAAKVLAHQTEVATGEGFVSGLGANSFEGLESRLRPRPVAQRTLRGAAIFWRVLTFPYWIWKKG